MKATSAQPNIVGEFSFWKMGENDMPIYKNSKGNYLYHGIDNYWAVSKKDDVYIFLTI